MFETISNATALLSAGRATVANRSIGEIVLDVTVEEGHESNLRITENPIESGAAIADHAVVLPKTVTIRGVVVDHDQAALLPASVAGVNIRGATDFLDQIPFPSEVKAFTAQTVVRANRELTTFATVAKDAAGHAARPLAPWMPDFALPYLNDSTPATLRTVKAYRDLLTVQKSGQTITINTGLRVYESMLISSISATQTKDGSVEIGLTATEIFVVDTQTVKGVVVPQEKKKTSPIGKKRSGRAAKQAAPKTQKGKVQTDDSLLNKLDGAVDKAVDTIKGWFGMGGKK